MFIISNIFTHQRTWVALLDLLQIELNKIIWGEGCGHKEKKEDRWNSLYYRNADNTSRALQKEVAYCKNGLCCWNWKFMF